LCEGLYSLYLCKVVMVCYLDISIRLCEVKI